MKTDELPPTTLEATITAAIAESKGTATRLGALIVGACDALERSADSAERTVGQRKEAGTSYAARARAQSNHLRDLVDRQQEALDTFNIVMFGRTGAGKSTLVEAFCRGNGESVSLGEGDWTTKITNVTWKDGPGCRFCDTPGINGWGRTVSREKLEAEARSAVEVADLVLLCFDDQGQQQGEFQKIAAWVKEHGKPSIAILNCKNRHWRMPTKAPYAYQRENSSRSLREHAGNIHDELMRVALFNVPVIALSSQRALFGRATQPYVGLSVKSYQKLRAEFSPAELESASNFPALESLLVEVLRRDARTIRLGMLERSTDSAFDSLGQMMDEYTNSCELGLTEIDKLITTTFEVVGYPQGQGREVFETESGQAALDVLEKLRDGPYQQSENGRFQKFVNRRLTAKLGKLRTESMGFAEECVFDAFARCKQFDAAKLQTKIFSKESMVKAGQDVLEASAEYLRRELNLAVDDARLDLNCIIEELNDVAGQTGRGLRLVGNAGTVGGFLSGIVATMVFFTPIGWGVAIGSGIGAMILKIFGKKAKKKAAAKALEARQAALADVRKAVHATYDNYQTEVEQAAVRKSLNSAAAFLQPTIDQAIGLHSTLSAVADVRDHLQIARAELRTEHAPQNALAAVARDLPSVHFPGKPNGRYLMWFGEDWIEDPKGLRPPNTAPAQQTSANNIGWIERLAQPFGAFVRAWKDPLQPGAGTEWADQLRQDELLAAHIPDLLEQLVLWADEQPQVHLVGDYSAGKSSFIKRLLVDDGQSVPDELEVRGDPTTDIVTKYRWKQVLLVDAPGFQSSRNDHTRLTSDALPQAAAIIVILQPNLLVGDTKRLERVLRGNRESGIASKLGRTLFVINRADDLGVDPEHDPEGFQQLVQRKRQELTTAMREREIQIDPTRVLAMASDPYGMVGDRRGVIATEYDANRNWDGFNHFAKAFRKIQPELLRNGRDRTILEGGLAYLARIDSAQATQQDDVQSRSEQLRQLEKLLQDGLEESRQLAVARNADLRRIIEDHAFGMLEEVLVCDDEEKLNGHIKQLSEWWTDAAFIAEIERWQQEYVKGIDGLFERLERTLKRRVASVSFRATFPELRGTNGVDGLETTETWWLRKVLKMVEAPLKGASRDVVYKTGKFFGGKFKPYGAINLSSKIVKIGGVIAVIGVVLDIGDAVVEHKREAEREAARKKLRDIVQESSKELIEQYSTSDNELGGPATYLTERQALVKSQLADVAKDGDKLRSRLGDIGELRKRIDKHTQAAWASLGQAGTEKA
jgi:predicted GTPase